MNWSTSTRSPRPQPKVSAIDQTHLLGRPARALDHGDVVGSHGRAEQRRQRGRHRGQLVGHLGGSLVAADLGLEPEVGEHPIERLGRHQRRPGVVEVHPGGHEALAGPGDEGGVGVEHRAIQAGTGRTGGAFPPSPSADRKIIGCSHHGPDDGTCSPASPSNRVPPCTPSLVLSQPPPSPYGGPPHAPGGQPSGPRAAAWDDLRRRRRTMRTMRWVMVGIGLIGGLLLMAAGATLTGAIVAGLAVARGVVLLVMTHRLRPRRP